MSEQGHNTKVYFEQGGARLVVESGGEIAFKAGSKLTLDGTQAAAIADFVAITGGESPTEAEFNALAVKVNSILAALRGAGIIAP